MLTMKKLTFHGCPFIHIRYSHHVPLITSFTANGRNEGHIFSFIPARCLFFVFIVRFEIKRRKLCEM